MLMINLFFIRKTKVAVREDQRELFLKPEGFEKEIVT